MLFVLLILSRMLFLANYPHFFDAPEYLKLAGLPNFLQSIILSHDPVHPVYLWLIRFARFPWQLSLVAAIFGIIGGFIFYQLIKLLFDQKMARLTLPVLMVLPHLWLIQTNILHEAVEQFFFLSSLFFWSLYLKKSQPWYLLGFGLALYLSLLTFVGMAIWLPIFIGLTVFLSETKKLSLNLFKLVVCLLMVFYLTHISYFLLVPAAKLHTLTQSYFLENWGQHWSVTNLLRMARNSLLILSYGYSPLSVVIIGWALYTFMKQQNWRLVILSLAFLIPFFLTAKFWYGGLYGRYSSLIAYYLVLMFALVFKPRAYYLALGVVCAYFVFTLYAYVQIPVPKIQAGLIKQLPYLEKSLLVISDYQRPQLEYEQVLPTNTLVILDDDNQNRQTISKIRQALDHQQPVYLTKQAVSFPYSQYDGQQLHIIGRGDNQKAKLALFLKNKNLQLAVSDTTKPLLNIYRLQND